VEAPPQAMAAAAGAEVPQVPASSAQTVDLLQRSIKIQQLLKNSGIRIGPNGELIRDK